MSISSGSEPDEVEDETAAGAAQLNKEEEQARQTAHQVEDQQGAEIAAWFNLEAEFAQREERQHKEINPWTTLRNPPPLPKMEARDTTQSSKIAEVLSRHMPVKLDDDSWNVKQEELEGCGQLFTPSRGPCLP